jgi:hypothetical protein
MGCHHMTDRQFARGPQVKAPLPHTDPHPQLDDAMSEMRRSASRAPQVGHGGRSAVIGWSFSNRVPQRGQRYS